MFAGHLLRFGFLPPPQGRQHADRWRYCRNKRSPMNCQDGIPLSPMRLDMKCECDTARVDGFAKICFDQSHRSAFFDVVFGVRFDDDRDDRRPPATRHRLVRPSVAVVGRDDDDDDPFERRRRRRRSSLGLLPSGLLVVRITFEAFVGPRVHCRSTNNRPSSTVSHD